MLGRDTTRDARDAEASRTNGASMFAPTKTPPSLQRSGPVAVDSSTSILGPDIKIIGQQLVLKTKGSLIIQGQIQGDVHGTAVTVDNGAHVTGVITAQTIAIQGDIKGALKGSTVILHSSSNVNADIVHQTLTIAEGAIFEGSVRRAKDVAEVTPDLS